MEATSALNMEMSTTQKFQAQSRVDAVNNAVNAERVAKKEMGKDEFLTLLIAQLSHQDPTAPMKDQQFIAQMAQFSSLEQMTNMSTQFTALADVLASGRAMNYLGRDVEIHQNGEVITGRVTEVAGQAAPRVLVDGRYYDAANIEKIME